MKTKLLLLIVAVCLTPAFGQQPKLEQGKPIKPPLHGHEVEISIPIPQNQLKDLQSSYTEARDAVTAFNVAQPLLKDVEGNKQALLLLQQNAEAKAAKYNYMLERVAREKNVPLDYVVDLQGGVFVPPPKGKE